MSDVPELGCRRQLCGCWLLVLLAPALLTGAGYKAAAKVLGQRPGVAVELLQLLHEAHDAVILTLFGPSRLDLRHEATAFPSRTPELRAITLLAP